MLFDIFSGFDPQNGTSFFSSFLVWSVVLLSLLISVNWVWMSFNYLWSSSSNLSGVAEDLVNRTMSKDVGGSVSTFSVFLLILIILNLLGLTPYVFSVTSHLAINLSLSLPIWGSIVLMSISYDLGSFLAHLQPMGSPAPLNPFLCVIELVSLLVRPITLAVRLTANLSTGHILMTLLGVGFLGSAKMGALMVFIIGVGYFMFEMAVCFIQAYIFTLLPTLYLDEHPSVSH